MACTAIRELGPEAWESAKNRAIVLDIHDREKSDLLAGMACSTDPSLLSKYNWNTMKVKFVREV